jgi:hypothetical protein
MDNISQTTPAHQLVSKETIPLINKPRSRGFFLGFEIFHFVIVLLLFFPIFNCDVFLFLADAGEDGSRRGN